jgi:hypothetical protein
MKNKKRIIIITVLSVFSGWVIWFGFNFMPGSNPYAEEYELNFSETELHTAIDKFKQEYPEYIVPGVTINHQDAGNLVDEPNSHWYNFYFYYKDENKILHTWTRPIGKNKTTFSLIGINDGLELGNWKEINKEEKRKFEKRILNKIKANLKK